MDLYQKNHFWLVHYPAFKIRELLLDFLWILLWSHFHQGKIQTTPVRLRGPGPLWSPCHRDLCSLRGPAVTGCQTSLRSSSAPPPRSASSLLTMKAHFDKLHISTQTEASVSFCCTHRGKPDPPDLSFLVKSQAQWQDLWMFILKV